MFNPISTGVGVLFHPPPSQLFQRTFMYDGMVREGFKYSLNSWFAIMYNISVKESFSMALNLGGYGRFCLKITHL